MVISPPCAGAQMGDPRIQHAFAAVRLVGQRCLEAAERALAAGIEGGGLEPTVGLRGTFRFSHHAQCHRPALTMSRQSVPTVCTRNHAAAVVMLMMGGSLRFLEVPTETHLRMGRLRRADGWRRSWSRYRPC